jgi:putative transposase
MKAYSLDFRQKIIDTYFSEPISQRQLARRFRISLSFVEKLLKQLRQTGSLAPKPHGGGSTPKLNSQQLAMLAALVQENNDATLKELCQQLYEKIKIWVSLSTMSRWLQALHLTRKKKRCTPLKEIQIEYNDCAWSIGSGCAT